MLAIVTWEKIIYFPIPLSARYCHRLPCRKKKLGSAGWGIITGCGGFEKIDSITFRVSKHSEIFANLQEHRSSDKYTQVLITIPLLTQMAQVMFELDALLVNVCYVCLPLGQPA